jgi:hypothetical protein
MTSIVTAADAAEFLSMVPHLLGFTPTRSVVLIPFHGGRSIGGMRVDLPPDDADAGAFAATALGLACRVSLVDAVVAIVYCDDPLDDGVPRRPLAEALERAAHRTGLRMIDLLCVGPEAWASYRDPGGVRPLSTLPAPPADARGAGALHPDQSAGAELPPSDLAERERVGRALIQLDRAMAVVTGRPGPSGGDLDERVDPAALTAVCALDDVPEFFDRAVATEPAGAEPYDLAALIWCLARPALRDIGLTAWIDGVEAGDAALEAQLRWEDGAEFPASLAERMMGEGERPDAERLGVALEVTRRAASLAPRAARPGALSVCAWLSWALGRSTHAERYGVMACEIDPEHGLSRIVLSMVQAGHLPDWAFRPGGSPRTRTAR